jgi:hypothetical protein
MKPFFKSQQFQEEFDKNGFVRVSLLTAQQTDDLLARYETIREEHENMGLPFTTTSQSNDHELIRKADEQIAAVFSAEIDTILQDYKLLFGNFLIKQSGPASITPLHQDTSFVDEKHFSSISIWVSLHDADQRNGCMRFIPGSHKFKHILRPTHAYPWPFCNVMSQLEELLEDYPSQRGEAFIFNHRVIHASYPNLTDHPRVAAVMAAYPADADLLMYFQEKDSTTAIQKYRMTKDAYLHFIKGEPPASGILIETEFFDYKPVTQNELRKMVVPQKSFIQQVRKFLSIF